jgi:hypothetical protein
MKHYIMAKLIAVSVISLLFISGCATTQVANNAGAPQAIDVKDNLTVHLYDSLTTLRAAYMYQGGNAGKINKVLGFYSETGNSIHCLKWDFNTCGHELFHALQFKGSPTLMVDKGYEHFDGSTYTAVEH